MGKFDKYEDEPKRLGQGGGALTSVGGAADRLLAAKPGRDAARAEAARITAARPAKNGAAGDASDMLAELSRLIESVQRFVRPDAAKDA